MHMSLASIDNDIDMYENFASLVFSCIWLFIHLF